MDSNSMGSDALYPKLQADHTIQDSIVSESDPLLKEKGSHVATTVGWVKFSFIVYFTVCGGSFG